MKAFQTLLATATMAIAIVASPYAAAHASLKSSDPQAGAVLASAPKEIVLTFNEKIEQAFSGITLTDSAGKAVAVGKAKVDEANPAVLRLETPKLAAGEYAVTWAVAGHDGHRRTGVFKFSLK
jgi:methionine-rich copper-binding protein CopC